MHTTLQLLLLVMLSALSTGEDIGHRDRQIIMQADLETVLIRTDLATIEKQLHTTELKLGEAREALMSNTLGKDPHKKRESQGLLSVIKSCTSLVKQTKERFHELINSTNMNNNREKRGIEFLGDVLSTITGVPSAQDHRKVIEMLWAVKAKSDGTDLLLKQSTKLNSQMLETLHLHEEKFTIFRDQMSVFDKAIGRHDEMLDKTILAISILAKVQASNHAINAIIARAEQILSKGDISRLSRYSISELDLGVLIDKIYMRRRTSSPIFDRRSTHYYYSLKLAHTWVDASDLTLNTILQIPIARLAETQQLALLESSNILQNDLHMAVVNEGRNEYRLLSSSDYSNCIHNPESTICQKREIKISPRLGCVIKQRNCRNWADKVVHDITNTEILISLPAPSKATLICDGKSDRDIELPKTALVHLDLNCELQNLNFTVHKLSFRHLQDVTINRGVGIKLDISDEVTSLTTGQVSHMIAEMTDASQNIDFLNKTNINLMQAMEEHTRAAEDRWEEASGGWSAWQQLAVWAAIGAEAIFMTGVTVCICRMYCSVLKKKSGQSSAAEESVTSLRDRILDLETNILLNTRNNITSPTKAIARVIPDIEAAD